jgi:hypothetical protein
VRGDLAVDPSVQLDIPALSVRAVVGHHVGEERGVVSAAAGASDASSGGGVYGWVFAVERCIREGQIEVGLNPRGDLLGG